MKLPFNLFLAPFLKPYLSKTIIFCKYPVFGLSQFYTYFYSTLGCVVNARHLKKHLGETPNVEMKNVQHFMLLHDLKIIATSMGIVQYGCLLFGCYTENPALFLPHLISQLFVVFVKVVNALLLLNKANLKSIAELGYKVPIKLSEDITESNRVRLRALLVALLGVSMSACAFASQPVELELEDAEIAQKLNNVSFARRITKPTIRLVMGYGKLSAFVTAITSLLLLIAIMSKQSWSRLGAKWLAVPAMLVVALEVASDTGDAFLAAALQGSSAPSLIAAQTIAAGLLVTVEILVWYFIAKFFEYNPATFIDDREKDNVML